MKRKQFLKMLHFKRKKMKREKPQLYEALRKKRVETYLKNNGIKKEG